jgi:hypothetical protein
VLSVFLTLCGIFAVIWWLTGSRSRDAASATDEIDVEVAEKAIRRFQKSASVGPSSKHEAFGAVIYDLLTEIGMDAPDAELTIRDLGYSVSADATGQSSVESRLSVVSLRDEVSRAVLERALLVGVQLARMDDDYAGVSDDAAAFASLRQRADDAETQLFDDHRRRRMEFYSRAVLVLQDRIQAERDSAVREVVAEILTHCDEELVALQNEMNQTMAALPDEDSLYWGDSEDRRLYYFKMGVTNSLRRSGHLDSLGHLYRFRGVNYDVEEAFQIAGEDEPLLLRAAQLDFSTLVSLRPADVRRITKERRLNRSISNTES